jgi:hypothetical protein
MSDVKITLAIMENPEVKAPDTIFFILFLDVC